MKYSIVHFQDKTKMSFIITSCTIVPALATPVVSGHLQCTATVSMSRHITTLNFLLSADTCLTRTRTVIYWFSVPAITDSVNKCSVFGGHFNPNSLYHTLTCDRQFAIYFPCCHLVTKGNISYREYMPA